MRQLTVVGKNRLEWRDIAEPRLHGGSDALVRPFVAARCDVDLGLIRGNVASAFRLGKLLRRLDPDAATIFGATPYATPFPLGHECVAEVIECGEDVRAFKRGDVVIVPFQVSCGSCLTCAGGQTAQCTTVPPFSMYGGVGGKNDGWGGALADCLRVPFADAMLVAVPEGVDPVAVASASDNLADGWRCVAPALAEKPGARVLIVGGAIKSIGLYAAAIAVALGSERVDYFDRNAERLGIAARIGANACEGSFVTGRPQLEYPILVDATNDARGLAFALRSTAPGGVCTSAGIFPRKETGIPLLRMYSHSLTLKNGVSSARPNIPALLELVKSGRLRPELITTLSAAWADAPGAFLENSIKVVVSRDRIHS